MRRVPARMAAVWHSGDFTGANRPIARATVQHGAVNLYNVSANKIENTYASIVFGPSEVPKELPNLKSVSWNRSVDTATATGQLVFYNTRPLQIGETPTRDLDGLGYYTYNRGQTSFANRWGQVPNEWANTLIPDNLIRTYEGYGCDPNVIPERDSNLLQSGTWIIDDVEYTHNGLITVSVSDLSRILSTQIIFPPVIPKAFYPLSFGGVPSHSGLRAPTLFTYTVDNGGMHDPAHPPPADYGGPVDGPVNVTLSSGDLQVHVTWQRPVTADTSPTGSVDQRGIQTGATPTKGFQVIGYRLVVDNVRLPTIYPANATSADIPGEVLMNGNVYAVHVVALWKELLNPAGEFYFKSNVELEEVSDYSQPVLYARPGAGPTAHAVPGSIAPNFSAALQLAPGQLHFGYVDGGVDIDWTCVAYLPKPNYSKPIYRRVGQPVTLDRFIFGVKTKAGQGVAAAFDVNELGDLEDWNYLVFGRQTGTVVRDDQTATFPGDMFFATTPGNFAFYAPPVTGVPAHAPGPAPTVPTITKGTVTTPLSATQVGAHYDDSSNTYYIGYGGNVAEHGHTANMAFDGDPNTYWLSIGNATPNAGFSFEWIQAAIPDITVTQVQFTTAMANYQVYISVLAKGVWVQHAPLDIIGYNPRLPESHNHGNIPFCEYTTTGPNEGPHTVTFRSPIPGATKVRISLHNLQNFPVSGYHFRGGMKDFQVLGMGEVPVDLVTAAPVVAGPPQDDNSPDIFKSYTVYTPPRIEPGAGENPGTYEDYCADEQTEALTARGWLRWDELEPGDLCLGMNPQTRLMEWQPVKEVYRQHRHRTMVSMESQLHSSLTTPDHKWLVVRQDGSAVWKTTATLKTGQRIPLAGPVAAPICAKHDDAFVELVAWFWTEGWFNGEAGNACLAQSETVNPLHTGRIRACLMELFGAPGRMLRGRGAMWNETPRDDGVVTFRLSKPVKDALLAVMDCEKVVLPGFLCALTAAQRTMFVERSLDADGWRTTKGRIGLAQRSERRAKAFEMACVLDGRPVRTRLDFNGMWSVNLLRSAYSLPQSAVVTEVDYDGVVWCPTLEHHNWVARRNGTIYVTGNSDIVKLFCAWGGFYWPEKARTVISDGSEVQYDFGIDEYGLPNVDPILGTDGSGRVWGDFEQTGTHGPALIPVQQWDKKPLLDGINFIKEIIGFTFFIDEQGGVIWRNPNIFSVGNWVSNFATDAGRVSNMVVIDEQDTLIGLRSKLSGRNVRERNFIASVDGRYGALNRGFNPNPIGLRRIGGWTDQHFLSTAECQVMADLIGIRQLLSYRTDSVTIPGYPVIQCDDQVQIFEQVTGEGFVHYVKAINNSLDMEAGSWTYTLDTNWLGEKPFGSWAFNPAELAPETQTYLDSLKIPAGAAVPEGGLFT